MNVDKASSINRIKIGWKLRHLVILIIAGLGTYLFVKSRIGWSEMHLWNRAVGDMGLVLIASSIVLGPLARLWKMFRITLPWRRECGIYGVLLAIIHTVIILDSWIKWDLAQIFGYMLHPQTAQYVMLLHGFGLANVIGIVALMYGMVLAASSNDWSQQKLSGSVWKYLQQGVYVLWMLVVVHTGYFLYIHFQHFHKEVPDPNWAQLPFAVLVGIVISLQLAAFLKTWKTKQSSHVTADPGLQEIVNIPVSNVETN